MPALQAVRVPAAEPAPDQYTCLRCGIVKTTKPDRPRPLLCRDCKDVLAYLADPAVLAHLEALDESDLLDDDRDQPDDLEVDLELSVSA